MTEKTETTNNITHVGFDGKGSELFKIYLVNLFLTIVTLGVYYFWAKVNISRYLYQHTSFMGNRFDYHATGREKFIGFVKGMGLLLIFFGLLGAIAYSIYQTTEKRQYAIYIMAFGFYLFFILFSPILMAGKKRYQLSRTSWNNIRFRFKGKVGELYEIFFKGTLLSIVTFGLYSAWLMRNVKKFFIENSCVGNEHFEFDGDGKTLLRIFLVGSILSFFTGGLYAFWLSADIERYYWNHTLFQGRRFQSTLSGGDLLAVNIKTVTIILLTFGLGFPWVISSKMRLLTTTIAMVGEPDLELISAQTDRGASPLTEGISEAGETLDAITDIFGF